MHYSTRPSVLRNCIYPIDEFLYRCSDFQTGMEVYIIDHRILHPAPEFLNLIQIGAVGWQKNQFQIPPVFFRETLQQLCMMNSGVIRNYYCFPFRILFQNVFQKMEKYLSIIFPVFFHINTTRFIVQTADQLHTFMLPKGWDDTLFSFQELGLHDRLVIPDHGFVFKQDPCDIIVQEFF